MKELKVSKGILIPMFITLISASLLAFFSYSEGRTTHLIVILPLVGVLFIFFLNWTFKKVYWDEDGLKIKGLFSEKEIKWNEITQIQFFRAGFKKVLYLSSTDKFLLIPMIFSGQNELKEVIEERINDPEMEKLIPEEGFKTPVAEGAMFWIAAFILLIILILRIF